VESRKTQAEAAEPRRVHLHLPQRLGLDVTSSFDSKSAGMPADSQIDPEIDVAMVDCGEVVRSGFCNDLSLSADLLKSGRQPAEPSALPFGPRQQGPFGFGRVLSTDNHTQRDFIAIDADV